MTESKINCWQYMRCGRQPGGANAAVHGVCPAATDLSYDGIHSGRCAGRFCWAVTGTLCGGCVQGTYARKRTSCVRCHFYQRVQAEEGTANLRTKFLRFVQPGSSLIKGLGYRQIPKGTRFIHQGEEGRTAHIIQRGACIKLVEKDGRLHPVDHFNEGDVVGFMALLTGEPESGHLEAESDMETWVIDKRRFDDLSEKDLDLVTFITEIVADRFDSRRPMAKRTIGPYIADDIIGRGGFSIVSKGTYLNAKRPVAIKMLRHHMALQPDFLDNFHREAQIISTLRHEHIIEVYDIIERYRTVFIIMEYLEGESVKDLLLRQHHFSPAAAYKFLRQSCEAAAHAHHKGLIHRDLNPSNMMILPRDQLKLIDFGLACPTGTDDAEFGGNLYYQAPELLDGHPADKRTDVYALGISAYEMVCGEIPHCSGDTQTFMRQRKTEPIPDPGTAVPDLSEVLRRFIVKACQKNPGERYADAGQALAQLMPQPVDVIENAMRMITNRIRTQDIDMAAESHIGLVRETNQDRFFLREFSDGAVLAAIADGLGGVPAGDMAADLVMEKLSRVERLESGAEEHQLADLAVRLDRVVADAQQDDPRLSGMGSTLILVWMKKGRAFWAHVGDSRLYLLRDRHLRPLTMDQTLARFLVAEGEITAEEAKDHYGRQVMDQCIGCGFCEPETDGLELMPGDLLLLSTDGLHRSMTAGQLEALLNAGTGAADTARALVKAALDAGGRDNITGVIAKLNLPG